MGRPPDGEHRRCPADDGPDRAGPIAVRRLRPDDWEQLRELRLASLADAPSAFTSTHDREAALGETTWRQRLDDGASFAAIDGPGAIGLASGGPGRPGRPDVRELVGMWVAAPYRRRGVARMLVERVAAWASGDGATTLTLGVTDSNPGARAAYLRMGLAPTGLVEPVWNDPTRQIEFLAVELTAMGGLVTPDR
jgi:GNAT superfamily N-acetyltransferase